MDRRDHPIEARELLRRDIDLAVRADVRLDARKDAELRVPLPHQLDLLELPGQTTFAQVMRVVGDRVVLVATRDGCRDHLLECRLAVRRPVRVRMQVAAQVGKLDEVRQLAAPRRIELPAVLA